MKKLRIRARRLLELSVEQMWDTLTGEFTLIFDDGEIETNAKETLYSGYAWDFLRTYPQTPVLKKHHVHDLVQGKNRLGSDTHLTLLGRVMWSVYDHHVLNDLPLLIGSQVRYNPLGAEIIKSADIPANEATFRDHLSEMIYRISNKMYNDLTHRLEEYVVSLDITDYIGVLRHPEVKAANESVQPTQKSIDETYAVIRRVLLSGTDLPDNPLSLASRSKIVNVDQVLQCVAPRGFLTDTDSNLFRKPIMTGYAKGIRRFHDSLIESRSAAKSLIFSKQPLQQAEYFSRRLQLMSQIVQRLHPGDCGTKDYLWWKVKAPVIDRGRVMEQGDLKQLIGKNYVTEDGTLKTITADDKHLEGKSIRLRSVVHCACPDPYGVCATCFGQLWLSVPVGTNIGQMCCTSLAQKSSQSVLSVKHHDGSSVVDPIVLDTEAKMYLKVATDDNNYLLADGLKNKKVQLVIAQENASNITDIMEVKDVADLNITRVSELTHMGLRVDDKPLVTLDVSQNRRLASMTTPLLRYIREKGWGFDEKNNFTIDMSEWDWSVPILSLPLKHFNLSDHSRDIASFLESSVEKMQERDNTVSPDAALIELFTLINAKLSVNLAVIEVVLYAAMIVSAARDNYELPKPWTDRRLGVMKLSMLYRSLAPLMAYEGHRDAFVEPMSFTETNRTDHPMDGVLMPLEVEAAKGWQHWV